jgi:hypothetical protein
VSLGLPQRVARDGDPLDGGARIGYARVSTRGGVLAPPAET